MRLRSCFLYTVAFLFVGTVCVMIAATMITGNNRAASVKRLKATLAAKGIVLDEGPLADQASHPSSSETPPPVPAVGKDTARQAYKDLAGPFMERNKTEAWREMYRLFQGDTPPAEWTDAQWKQMSTFMAENQDLVEAIRAMAAANGPLVQLEHPLRFDTSLEHLAKIRAMARLLAMDALVGGHGKDMDRIVADVEACLGLAHGVAQDGIVISNLVSIAIGGIAQNILRDAVVPGTLGPERTRALVDALGDAYGHDAFTRALANEAGMGMGAFEAMRNGESGDPQYGDVVLDRLYGSMPLRPLLDADAAAHAEAMEALIAASDRPYYQVRGEMEALQARLQEGFPFTRLLTRALVPALTNVLEAQARHVAEVDLMRMGLLLEEQYAETGRYPDSLNAIAEDLGEPVPVDPFTGNPYRYIPEGDTFRLYSVGRNLSDEGGSRDWQAGDWPWRVRNGE